MDRSDCILPFRRFKVPRPQRSSGGSEGDPSARSSTNYRQDLVLNYTVVFRAKEAVLEMHSVRQFIERIVVDRLKHLNVSGARIYSEYAETNAKLDLLKQGKHR